SLQTRGDRDAASRKRGITPHSLRLHRGNDRPLCNGRICADKRVVTPPCGVRTAQRAVPYLRGSVADFIAQISDEKTEALIERALFEQVLPAQWIVHECRTHKVGQHFQIA